jgi:hypothetical protein
MDERLSPVKDSTYLRLSNSRAAVGISKMVIRVSRFTPTQAKKKPA